MNFTLKKWAAFVVAMGTCVAANAEGQYSAWQLTYEEPQGTLQIHESSLYGRALKEHIGPRKVRTRMSYRQARTNSAGKTYWSVESVDLYTCAEWTVTPVSRIEYAGRYQQGAVVGSVTIRDAKPLRIAPGSTEQLVLAEANCSLTTGRWGIGTP